MLHYKNSTTSFYFDLMFVRQVPLWSAMHDICLTNGLCQAVIIDSAFSVFFNIVVKYFIKNFYSQNSIVQFVKCKIFVLCSNYTYLILDMLLYNHVLIFVLVQYTSTSTLIITIVLLCLIKCYNLLSYFSDIHLCWVKLPTRSCVISG